MNKEKAEKMIRETWFNDHKAELKNLGEIQILNWREPGTIFYSVRYVFDGHRLYISGDLGEAVFNLTWKADVYSFDDIYLHYFVEKLAAYSEEIWDFNQEKAIKRLNEWVKELSENNRKYNKKTMIELIQIAGGCSSVQEWANVVNSESYNDFIISLDNDYWEWFYKIGNEYPLRLQAYLIGLKMASKQLKESR